ncbi:helix-turn-helix transcriptional regulator [Mucilaginibacter mali]|uniref:Helix-turn-helix transcriptional regulator n=1 Tax=Mucilaginibacter mali TaxID=2740462 RepID=A0A7D4QB74_9SPHI|nr:helix-turn-helix transcriptional regulator [Mucilaginibacter mali]QKJ32451.1 helix-turn-helix transcriptional regulator [Mucilaginibacter mali]
MAKERQRRNEKGISVLGGNIRKYRGARGLTIEQLANLLEVDYSQISRMERGVVNAHVSMVFDIAEALGVSASQLLEDAGQ